MNSALSALSFIIYMQSTVIPAHSAHQTALFSWELDDTKLCILYSCVML